MKHYVTAYEIFLPARSDEQQVRHKPHESGMLDHIMQYMLIRMVSVKRGGHTPTHQNDLNYFDILLMHARFRASTFTDIYECVH